MSQTVDTPADALPCQPPITVDGVKFDRYLLPLPTRVAYEATFGQSEISVQRPASAPNAGWTVHLKVALVGGFKGKWEYPTPEDAARAGIAIFTAISATTED